MAPFPGGHDGDEQRRPGCLDGHRVQLVAGAAGHDRHSHSTHRDRRLVYGREESPQQPDVDRRLPETSCLPGIGGRRHWGRFYSRPARLYDLFVGVTPSWRRWLRAALPNLKGPRVLEVSFGTGHLLTRYAGRVDTVFSTMALSGYPDGRAALANALFDAFGLRVRDREIGGWGSVHRWVATRENPADA